MHARSHTHHTDSRRTHDCYTKRNGRISEIPDDPNWENLSKYEVYENEEENNASKAGITVEEHEVIFRYYNSKYLEGERVHINNVTEDLKGWRKNTPLKIVTHGWLSSESSGAVDGVKNGLDPAGPAFEIVNHITHNSLDMSDAEFVDVIHTAGGAAGFYDVLGHADFYPNGGTPIQPGCMESNSASGIAASFSCSHSRSYEFYQDSIWHPHSFKAYQCPNWESFENKSCKNHRTVYMGDETPSTARGVYYLMTRGSSPYGMQIQETDN